ncbi:MAG: InlB B-repeat-containing protein [Clostridia bacterium]|nr:InlB B-repeat-containing protein [Clostridia bacterium]
MKRTLALLLVLIAILISMASCGSPETDKPGDDTPSGDLPGEDTPGEETPGDETPKVTYTITWVDEDGETITTSTVEEGKLPSYSYTVTDTAEWDYTFEGWSATAGGDVLIELPVAAGDASYYAKVSAVKQKYTVSFNTNGGSEVEPQTVEYGSKATAPEAPTLENHKFMGWSSSQDEYIAVDFDREITGDVECFAFWNEVVDVKALLEALLSGYELNPFSYIPESMRFDYSANLVDPDDIVSDYSTFVDISDITYGHGEQWGMVLQNLSQSMTFFNVLSTVESLSATSIAAFNNYFDKNPGDTAHHEFESGIYNVTINFNGEIMTYVLDYTATLPVLGEQTVQIALAMDTRSGEKTARIQLGDANALTYTVLDGSYEFAIKYLGIRRAMFSVSRDDDGSVSGKIYEYLTAGEVEVASAAEFYITEDNVSVVGNKASGLLGFTGYISELYDVESGALVGYEVMETLSSITYNTLWFNLADIGGIESIKYVEAVGEEPAKLYVNGSSTAWEAKTVGGLGLKMFSRRFDIEFRTQYVYSYDAANDTYVQHTVKVPMIFVQEENYETFIDDVKATNKVNVSVGVSADELNKILEDYDTLIPTFIDNKSLITPDIIIAYIGEKITF